MSIDSAHGRIIRALKDTEVIGDHGLFNAELTEFTEALTPAGPAYGRPWDRRAKRGLPNCLRVRRGL